MKAVRLGAGLAFWGDSLEHAVEMVNRAEIDYLCCDHLAELTMSILNKQKQRDPKLGYTSDILDLLRIVLPQCRAKGIRVVTNSGGANPRACVERIVELCRELGMDGLKIGLVTGDDILERIEGLVAQGVTFENLDTGEPLDLAQLHLTHANAYIGCEGIVEALTLGADIVVCGRVTDMALYLGPMRYELGWAADDWHRLGIGTAVAHTIECGGLATGGIYSGGWQEMQRLEAIGHPIANVVENGEVIITKTPDSGGEVSPGTVSEQLVYEIHDPSNYVTADVVADLSSVALDEVGKDQVRISRVTGKPRPPTLKVNMGYRAGFIGEVQFTYTWPDAYAKARAAIEFLESRLRMVNFKAEDVRVEFLGCNSMWGDLVPGPSPDANEVVVRYAARCADAAEARKVYTEAVPLYSQGPAGVAGIGTRPPVKELFALWPCLIPREHVAVNVIMVKV